MNCLAEIAEDCRQCPECGADQEAVARDIGSIGGRKVNKAATLLKKNNLVPASDKLMMRPPTSINRIKSAMQMTDKLLLEQTEKYFNLGFVSMNSSLQDNSDENFSRAIQADPQYPEKNNLTYRVAVFPDDYKKAIEYFDKALFYDENHIISHYFRGIARYKVNELMPALEDFTKVIDSDPGLVSTYIHRAFVKYKLDDLKGSAQDITRAIELNPGNSWLFYNRAVIREDLGDYTGALEDYTLAISLNDHDSDAYNNRGVIRYELKMFQDAILDFDKALELRPDHPYAYNNRGATKHELKKYQSAIADFTNAIQLNHRYATAYYNRAESRIGLKIARAPKRII